MRILVDADACPVVSIVEHIAKKYQISVILLCDTNHILQSDYSEVLTVGAGADAVDFKLVSVCQKDDIVVTQDYGVAAMILGKGAYGIHQSGRWYTNENIDQMLMERHLAKKARNHPLDWLSELEMTNVERKLNSFDLVLNGHVHDLQDRRFGRT